MNFVLLTWALCGGLFIYAFLANFRTMLLMPQYEKPIDSAQEILDRGMIPFVTYSGDYWKQFLLESPNPIYQKLGEITVVPKDNAERLKMINESVLVANTHVYMGRLTSYLKSKGNLHGSKEILEGTSSFGGDILNKKWSHGEEYSYHLMLFHQVRQLFQNTQKIV